MIFNYITSMSYSTILFSRILLTFTALFLQNIQLYPYVMLMKQSQEEREDTCAVIFGLCIS